MKTKGKKKYAFLIAFNWLGLAFLFNGISTFMGH